MAFSFGQVQMPIFGQASTFGQVPASTFGQVQASTFGSRSNQAISNNPFTNSSKIFEYNYKLESDLANSQTQVVYLRQRIAELEASIAKALRAQREVKYIYVPRDPECGDCGGIKSDGTPCCRKIFLKSNGRCRDH